MELQRERPREKKKAKKKAETVSQRQDDEGQAVEEQAGSAVVSFVEPAETAREGPVAGTGQPECVDSVDVGTAEGAEELSMLEHVVGDRALFQPDSASVYPSAPALNDDEDLLDEPADLSVSRYPDLYNTIAFQPTAMYPPISDLPVTPSAPPIHDLESSYILSATFTVAEPTPDPSLTPYFDAEAAFLQVDATLDSFPSTYADPDPTFRQRLVEYCDAVHRSRAARVRAQTRQVEARTAAGRAWKISRDLRTERGACADGRQVSVQVQSTTAVFDDAVGTEVLDALDKLRQDVYTDVAKANFESKVAKMWIQDHIDDVLAKSKCLDAYLPPSKSAKPNANPSTQTAELPTPIPEFLARLRTLLSILFEFERSRSTASTPGLAPQAAPFLRDVRGWISHLCGAMLKVGGQEERVFVLWEVLNTSGVGEWGAWILHYPVPTPVTLDWLLSYLSHLRAFMSRAVGTKPKPDNEGEDDGGDESNDDAEWVVVVKRDLDTEEGGTEGGLTDSDLATLYDQFQPLLALQRALTDILCDVDTHLTHTSGATLSRVFAISRAFLTSLTPAVSRPRGGAELFSKRVARDLVAIPGIVASLLRGRGLLATDTVVSFSPTPGTLTTPHVEIDTLSLTSCRSVLHSRSAGVWQVLADVDLKGVTEDGLWSLLLETEKWNLKHTEWPRDAPRTAEEWRGGLKRESVGALRGKGVEDVVYLAGHIGAVGLEAAERVRGASGGEPRVKAETVVEVAAWMLWRVGFLDADIAPHVSRTSRDLISHLCSLHPPLMSSLWYWTLSRLSDTGLEAATYLWRQLPVAKWRPRDEDFQIVERVLDEGEREVKGFILNVVVKCDWGGEVVEDGVTGLRHYTPHLPIPTHHRVAHALARMRLTKPSKPQKGPDKGPDMWTLAWSLLIRLDLFEPPGSWSGYDGTGHGAADWNDDLVGDAMAAYIAFGLGRVGKDPATFKAKGWAALKCLLEKGTEEAFVKAVTRVVGGFLGQYGEKVVKEEGFGLLFKGMLQSTHPYTEVAATAVSSAVSLRSPSAATQSGAVSAAIIAHFEGELRNYASGLPSRFPPAQVELWTRVATLDPGWMCDRQSVTVLDVVCHYLVATASDWSPVTRILVAECGRLGSHRGRSKLEQLVDRIPTSYIPSSLGGSRIESILQSVYRTETVVGHCAQLTLKGAAKSVLGLPNVDLDHIWFSAVGLRAEAISETALRKTLGTLLLCNKSLSAETAYEQLKAHRVPKPLRYFSIYRLVEYLEQIATDHPLASIFWDQFLHLYFERLDDLSPDMTQCFGFRLVRTYPRFCDECERVVAKIRDSVGVLEANRKYYRTLLTWLDDVAMRGGARYLGNLAPEYNFAQVKNAIQTPLESGEVPATWRLLVDLKQHQVANIGINDQRQSADMLANNRARRESRSYTQGILESLAQSPPNFVMRRPIEAKTSNQIHSDLNYLLMKATDFDSTQERHAALDADYVASIRSLYKTETLSKTVDADCRSLWNRTCAGAARITYSHTDISALDDVKNHLEDNRQKADDHVLSDLVSLPVAAAVLRIVGTLEDASASASSSLNPGSLFFKFLESMDAGDSNRYPPLAMVLQRGTPLVARMFESSGDVASDVFSAILRGDSGATQRAEMVKYFRPHTAAKGFPTMYKRLCEEAVEDAEGLVPQVLEKFAVNLWLQGSPEPSVESRKQLLETVVSALRAEHVVARRELQTTASAHLKALLVHTLGRDDDLLSARMAVDPNTSPLVREVFAVAAEEVASAGPSTEGQRLLPPYLSREILETVRASFGREHTRQDGTLFRCYGHSLVSLKRIIQLSFLSLLRRVPPAATAEVLQLALAVYEPWLVAASGDAGVPRTAWDPESDLEVSNFLTVFGETVLELGSRDTETVIPALWSFYSDILHSRSPEFVLRAFYSTLNGRSLPWSLVLRRKGTASELLDVSSRGLFTPATERFLLSIIAESRALPGHSSPNDPLSTSTCLVMLQLFQAADVVGPTEGEARDVFGPVEELISRTRGRTREPDRISEVFSAARTTWNRPISSVADPRGYTGSALTLWFLRLLSSQDAAGSLRYADHCTVLLATQVADEASAFPRVRNFERDHVAGVAREILEMIDTHLEVGFVTERNGNPTSVQAWTSLRLLLSLPNTCDPSGPSFACLSTGLAAGVRRSGNPIAHLTRACDTVANTGLLATLAESAISRHLELHGRTPDAWREVAAALRVPQLDTDGFLAVCVDTGSPLVLRVYAEKLVGNEGDRTVLDAMLPWWLARLQPREGKEADVVPLVLLFGDRLRLEEDKAAGNAAHVPILLPSLPTLATTLSRWGRDRETTGLLGVVGMGVRSPLAANFRLWSRCLAGFAVSRGAGDPVQAAVDRTRRAADLVAAGKQAEYAGWTAAVEWAADVVEDQTRGPGWFGEFAEGMRLRLGL